MEVPTSTAVRATVIIAVRDRAEDLERALGSLEPGLHPFGSPDSPSFEIVVVDDASRRPIAEALTSRRERWAAAGGPALRVIRREVSVGPGLARNLAAQEAQGDVLLFLDSDCEVQPGWLRALLRPLGDSAVVAVGGAESPDPSEPLWPSAFDVALTSWLTTGGVRGHTGPRAGRYRPRTFSMAVRRSSFEAAGGFRGVRGGEDVDLSDRLVAAGGRVVYAPEARVVHHRRRTLTAFWRQSLARGRARGSLVRHARRHAEPIYLLPFLVVVGMAGLAGAAVWVPAARGALRVSGLAVFGYLGLVGMLAGWSRRRVALLLAAPVAVATQILGYALGMVWGLVRPFPEERLSLAPGEAGPASPAPSDVAPAAPSLAGDSASLVVAGASSRVLAALGGFLGARALGPARYGVWQAVRLVLQAGGVTPLGAVAALRREVPLAKGRGEVERLRRLRRTAVGITLLGASVIAVGCLVAAQRMGAGGASAVAAALLAASVVCLLQQLWRFVDTDARADAHLRRSAAGTFVAAAVAAGLTWPLCTRLGAAGLVLSVGAGWAAGLLVTLGLPPARWHHLRPGLDRSSAVWLVRVGWPIAVLSLVAELRRGVDKLVLLSVSGTHATGLYGLGDTLAGLLGVLPISIAQAVSPRAIEGFGRTRDKDALREAVLGPLHALSRVGPLLVSMAALACEVGVPWILPRYAGGVEAARLLVLAGLMAGLEGLALNAIIALGRQRTAASLSVGFTLAAAVADVALLRAGWGIEAVAAVSLAAATGLSLTFSVMACRWLDVDWRSLPGALGGAFARLAYGGGVVWLGRFSVPGTSGVGAVVVKILVALVLTAPLAAPVLWRLLAQRRGGSGR